jgi:hypothetical protein
MARTEWQTWCRKEGFQAGDDAVICWFGRINESRKHVVRVSEGEEDFALEATIVGRRVLEQMARPAQLDAWQRNRAVKLVGFRVDVRGRLLAEARVPKHGLKPDEFRIYLMAVATEADRLELMLTGRDVQ